MRILHKRGGYSRGGRLSCCARDLVTKHTPSLPRFQTAQPRMASLPVCLLLAVLIVQAAADITNTRVSAGQCVCVQGTGVNVRSGPGLSNPVITSVNTGSCYTLTGRSQDANGFKWFEASISGQNLWIAGKYLNIGTAAQCSGGTGQCDGSAKALACELLQLKNSGKIGIWAEHPSKVPDQAYAITNIQDTCNGRAAHRSAYKCSLCAQPAPGGTVCLSSKLLTYLVTLARKGRIHINELAGACHNCNSAHYRGTAVDLHNGDGRNSEYLSLCKSMGGLGLDEGNHIHCNF